MARKELVLGLQHYTRRDLEAVRAAGETLEIRVLGLASIADDVSPELALETIDSIDVLGAFRASPDVKAVLEGVVKTELLYCVAAPPSRMERPAGRVGEAYR